MARPLSVLVYSEDRQVLRHLSRSLSAFGYEVRQAAKRMQALAEIEAEGPHVLLVDSEPNVAEALELCRAASSDQGRRRPFIFLLLSALSARGLTEALEAGVDDFLARPVIYGELLARLRAAARVLEFERRAVQQSGVDDLTGLPNGQAFRRRLDHRRAAGKEEQPSRPAACVLVDLDLLDRINHLHGHTVGDAVIRATAEKLASLCGPTEWIASFGGGRFAMLVPGMDDAEARDWAELLRAEVEESPFSAGSVTIRVTASFGVAPHDAAQTIDETLARAEQALQAAKSSGRNCVVRYGDHDDRMTAWTDFAAPGKLFERTTARDVMTPVTRTLGPGESAAHAAAIFRRTRAAAIPVVHADGRLAGLVLPESLPSGAELDRLEALRVGEVMTTDVPQEDETARFAALREFFTRDSRPVIVIVRAGRPTGLVTPDNLAALSTPLSTETFAAAECLAGSQGLLVPDLRPLETG